MQSMECWGARGSCSLLTLVTFALFALIELEDRLSRPASAFEKSALSSGSTSVRALVRL
jgi:hypothetical protein